VCLVLSWRVGTGATLLQSACVANRQHAGWRHTTLGGHPSGTAQGAAVRLPCMCFLGVQCAPDMKVCLCAGQVQLLPSSAVAWLPGCSCSCPSRLSWFGATAWGLLRCGGGCGG
jgi:hypothetical protein